MSRCPECGAEMRPLLTGEFCPADCDRKMKAPDPFELPCGSKTLDDWADAIEEWYATAFDETPPADQLDGATD